jgi:hypothetical protein
MIRVAPIILVEVVLRWLVEVMLWLSGPMHLRTQRPVDRHASRPAIVASEVRASVTSGRVFVRVLEGGHVHVMFALGSPLIRAAIVVDSAGAAAKGDVAVSDNVASIHTPTIKEGHAAVEAEMHHGSVVGKVTAAPFAADKADAAVAEAVVHATVVANVRPPVTSVEEVHAVLPTPVGRSPQVTGLGRGNPRSGNPVVAVIAVGPVTGGPHKARLGAGWLLIDR